MKKKICVFTGTRAEYGLLKPLMHEIKNDELLQLQIIASGMHLSQEFGLTYREIEEDGFKADDKIEMLLSSDTSIGASKAMGLGLISFAESYNRLRPDILVILGDRYEAFAAAIAALMSRIPVAHIQGGEATFGLIDEAIRHSITKISGLHFTSTKEYRKRVIQLGENPNTVFTVGALGIDNIKKLKLLSREMLEKELGVQFKKNNLLVTFHPVTLEKDAARNQFRNLLEALNKLDSTQIFFTKANADSEGRLINNMIDNYVTKHPDKSVSFISLGQLKYLSVLKQVDAVVGNSSSGIIEAPSFKVATVNIGNRQEGRIAAQSVINCEPETQSILETIKKVKSDKFIKSLKNMSNPYGDGNAAVKIKEVLRNRDFRKTLKKRFYDLV